jgi:hypothetical protein
MQLTTVQDFAVPVLKVLDALGGRARITELHAKFYEMFGRQLDPAVKDWNQPTKNNYRNGQFDMKWQDYCGTRVAYSYLKPGEYITSECHGRRGTIYILTAKGRAKAREA